MKQAYSKGVSGWGQFGILIGLVGVGFIIGGILSLVVWVAMTHTSFFDMPAEMQKPQNYSALLVVQAVSTVIGFFLPAFLYAQLCYRKGWTFLGFTGKINPAQVLCVVLLAFCSIPLITGLSELNKAIPLPASLRLKFDTAEKNYDDMVSQIAQVKSWGQYFVSLLIIAALPAIVEETLFRGALQNMLTRWTNRPGIAIFIASVLFSLVHLSWYGFIPRMVLGVLLGLLFYYGQNIWLNILAHFINNALVVTGLFISYRSGKPIDVSAEEHFPLWATLGALALIGGLVYWFIRSSPPPETSSEDFTFDTSNPFANQPNYVE